MSSGSIIRPMGISATDSASSASGVIPLRAARSATSPIYRSVRVLPGWMQFTKMPSAATSSASALA